MTKSRIYTGRQLSSISFPLGGIGTGNINLNGYGEILEWEIFNRPNKGSLLPFTFPLLYIKGDDDYKWVGVLASYPNPPYTYDAYGFRRFNGEGLPHISDNTFIGEYPFAYIYFKDSRIPLDISLEAFNPFIPHNEKDSGIPVACLTYRIKNLTDQTFVASIAFSVLNCVGYDGFSRINGRFYEGFGLNINEFREDKSTKGIFMYSKKYARDHPRFGSVAIGVLNHDNITFKTSLKTLGKSFLAYAELYSYWKEFADHGTLDNNMDGIKPSADGTTRVGAIASTVEVKSGEEKEIVFLISWYFPNRLVTWHKEEPYYLKYVGNWYATQWNDAWDVLTYTAKSFRRLRTKTLDFHDALFSSTLPIEVIDAVSSNLSILKTNTCMRIETGELMCFEGCGDQEGCCPMNCTHVYNYEQAIAFLFPSLERSMRIVDFLINLEEDGKMAFRTRLPLDNRKPWGTPAADGQMGCILKVYREWLLSGDDDFLKKLWPHVKRSLEYAWKEWDLDVDGVMEQAQHNTYDVEFYGANTMVGSLYLAALLAIYKMAKYLGDKDAEKYREIFVKGKEKLDKLTWNGEYYIQRYDTEKAPRFQYGIGCLSDQVIGQWFSHILGLGYILPKEHVRKALKSILRYNWKNLREHANTFRVYALEDEKGLVVCSWPKGGRPEIPVPYADEVWTGIEYQVASHLIYEGFVEEGLEIVKEVRRRYDGEKRNPWDELECGHHYARALSSWSLILSLSGFYYSAPEKTLKFDPKIEREKFRVIFVTGDSWGIYEQRITEAEMISVLKVLDGALEIKTLKVPNPGRIHKIRLFYNGNIIDGECSLEDAQIVLEFADKLVLRSSDQLEIKVLRSKN